MKPGWNASEPYRRNRAAGIRLVSDPSRPLLRKIILPKLSTSFLVQPLLGALKRRHILSSWHRSASLLAASDSVFLARASDLVFPARSTDLPFVARSTDLPFLARRSACSPPALCFGSDATTCRRSDGPWLTAASFLSSSPATTRPDRDQFVAGSK